MFCSFLLLHYKTPHYTQVAVLWFGSLVTTVFPDAEAVSGQASNICKCTELLSFELTAFIAALVSFLIAVHIFYFLPQGSSMEKHQTAVIG